MTENQRYLQELLRLIREDIGTPEILAQLHNLLARDRAVLQDYIREMHLQASLNWLLDGQVPGGTAVRAEVRRQLWARRRCWVWRGVGSLVAVCLLATLGFVAASRWMGGEEDDALVVGRIRAAKTPDWAGEAQGDEGARIRVGQEFDLLRGLVELEFRNGARVTLEGPAICRIESSNRVLLTGGRLLADVPPAAVGFTVDTPSARVVDLGTRFGVVVGSDGSPEIHVLAGSVRVESERLPPERLEVDQASRYSPDGETRRSIPLALIPFRPCLTLSAGIAELTGQARFAAEPSETVDESGETRPDLVHVLLERRGLRLPSPVAVIPALPGKLNPLAPPKRAAVPAGTRVDAYLLHLESLRGSVARCQLTFTRPVVGLLLDPESLKITDDLFRVRGFRYLPPGRDPDTRGALLPAGGHKESGDSLELSADRRTLTLRLQAGDMYLDQIRILVETEPKPPVAGAL